MCIRTDTTSKGLGDSEEERGEPQRFKFLSLLPTHWRHRHTGAHLSTNSEQILRRHDAGRAVDCWHPRGGGGRLRTTIKRARESRAHTPPSQSSVHNCHVANGMACGAVELPFFKEELPSLNRQRAHPVSSTWASQGLVTSSKSAAG
jgi:hypothetical protein